MRHEMRNPLSALIGCADEIIASLKEYRSSFKSPAIDSRKANPENLGLINEAIEAADTIIYCAMHQVSVITYLAPLFFNGPRALELSRDP